MADELLGPPEGRTPDTTPWENLPGVQPLRNGPRCYNLATSFQVPRQMTSPTAGTKIIDRALSDVQDIRKRMVAVGVIDVLIWWASDRHSLLSFCQDWPLKS